MDSEDQMAVTLIDNGLPEGWALSSVRDLIEISYGKGLKESNRKVGPVPVYGSNGVVGKHNVALTKGPSIIIGRKGSVGAVHFSPMACWSIDTTYYIDNFSGLNPQFLMHALRTLDLADLDTSTAIPGLNRNDVYDQEVPLPPLNEQNRIVVKVEELLARVNSTKERLAKVSLILKRFRQAVLAAACSGRLTAAWRNTNLSSETAQTLLEQIKIERNGTGVKSHKKTDKIIGYDSEVFPDLPDSWLCAPLGEIIKNFDSKRIPLKDDERKKREGSYPYYGASGIIDSIDDYLFDGEFLLIAEDGANLLSRSTPIAFRARGKFWVNNHAHIVQTHGGIPLQYLEGYLNGIDLQHYVTGSAQPKLTQVAMNRIPVPLPPLTEQKEIVRRVEAMFKLADAVEKRVAAATTRAEKLSQAILAKAFRGELVPTEADLARRERRSYEPASKLLARIKSERESKVPLRKIPKGRKLRDTSHILFKNDQ